MRRPDHGGPRLRAVGTLGAGLAGLIAGVGVAWIATVALPRSSPEIVSAASYPLTDEATGKRSDCDDHRQLDARLVRRHQMVRARFQTDWTNFTIAHGEPLTPPDPLPPHLEPEAIAARLAEILDPSTYVLNCEYFPCIAKVRQPVDEALTMGSDGFISMLGYPNATASGSSYRGPSTTYIVRDVVFFAEPPTKAHHHWGAAVAGVIDNPFPDPE